MAGKNKLFYGPAYQTIPLITCRVGPGKSARRSLPT
jgi:hypothetical protein